MDTPELTTGPSSPWRKALGYVVGGLILACLVVFLAGQWKRLPPGGVHADAPLLALSTASLLVFLLIQATGWKIIVSGLGPRIPLLPAWRYYFFSLVAKYVPGKVMLPLVRARYCLTRGTTVQATLLSLVIEMVLMVSTGCLAFVASTGAQAAQVSRSYLALYSLLVPAALIGIHPRVLGPAVNFGLRLIRRAPIRIDLSYRTMVGLLLLFQSCWIAYGVAAYLLCRAVDPTIGPEHLIAISGIFALGWVIGFVSIISPGGLGFREGALLGFLAVLLPGRAATLTIIVLVSRLQWTGLEVAIAGVLALFRERQRDTDADAGAAAT